MTDYDTDKVDDAVLALLHLTRCASVPGRAMTGMPSTVCIKRV
jgi:hypothetical protein